MEHLKDSKHSFETDIFQREIAVELLKERKTNITEAEIDEIWNLCNGNPWNAPILYELCKIAKDNFPK